MMITFGYFAVTEGQKIPASHEDMKDWLKKMSELIRDFDYDASMGKLEESLGLENVPDIGRPVQVTYIDAAFRTLFTQVLAEVLEKVPPVGTCLMDKTVHEKTETCEKFVPLEKKLPEPISPAEDGLLDNLAEFIEACRRFSIQPNRYDFVKWYENGGRRCTWGEYEVQEALEEAL